MTKEEIKAYNKAWYEAHKEQVKASVKAYYKAHKEEHKASKKAWREVNKEHCNEYMKAYRQANKEEYNAYTKAYNQSDVNSLGQTKDSIRKKSRRYLKKYGTNIPGYEIHHCFGYDDASKFIYCSIEMHRTIHKYLRNNNISADSDHYKYIEHLLNDSVVKYGFN